MKYHSSLVVVALLFSLLLCACETDPEEYMADEMMAYFYLENYVKSKIDKYPVIFPKNPVQHAYNGNGYHQFRSYFDIEQVDGSLVRMVYYAEMRGNGEGWRVNKLEYGK